MDIARKLVSAQHKGLAGEHLVCADFLVKGFNGMINPFPGSPSDVLVDLGNGVPLRVQVKTTLQVQKSTSCLGFPRTDYIFQLGGSKEGAAKYLGAGLDIFAFVALDKRAVLYLPASDILNGKKFFQKRFNCDLFLTRAANSLDRVLAAF